MTGDGGAHYGQVPGQAALGEPVAVVVEGSQAPSVAPPDLRRYTAYRLIWNVGLTNAIWVIFLHERGLSLAQIGLAEAAFHLAPITLELPTGSLADTFGRKWSLAIGGIMSAIAALVMLAVNDIWLALPAMYLSGAAMTFASGTQEAFLYDSLAAGNSSDRFTAIFGRLLSLSFLIIGITAWLGASLAEISFVVPYALTAGFGLLTAWIALGLREPKREQAPHRSISRTIAESIRIVHGQPGLAGLLGFAALFWTSVTLIELYAQAVLSGMGLTTSLVGLIIGGSFAVVAAGVWIADRVTRRGDFQAWTIGLALLTAAGAIALGSEILMLALVVYVIFEFSTGLYEPLLAARINRDLAPGQRATILSFQGFLFSLTMIWAFPLVGWIAERGGWLVAFGTVAVALFGALGVWLMTERRGAYSRRTGPA
jgi:MFS family permease